MYEHNHTELAQKNALLINHERVRVGVQFYPIFDDFSQHINVLLQTLYMAISNKTERSQLYVAEVKSEKCKSLKGSKYFEFSCGAKLLSMLNLTCYSVH